MPRRDLKVSEQRDWRCGRNIHIDTNDEKATVVCNPDGSMAGIGISNGANQLRPKVVFDAIG